jgi:hypothetical protein
MVCMIRPFLTDRTWCGKPVPSRNIGASVPYGFTEDFGDADCKECKKCMLMLIPKSKEKKYAYAFGRTRINAKRREAYHVRKLKERLSHPTPPQGVADARGMTEDDET